MAVRRCFGGFALFVFLASGSLSSISAQQLSQVPLASHVPSVSGPERGGTADRGGETLWKFSITALAAANGLDIASSWGKAEQNPALAAPSQKFGTENALIKVAILGGVTGVEWVATRRGKRKGTTFGILNFCS